MLAKGVFGNPVCNRCTGDLRARVTAHHDARSRIAKGTYGVCLHCEEDISPKRVNAVPWASFCIKCQEQVDRHEIEVEDMADLFASSA